MPHNASIPTTAQSLGALIKSARDIMRKDRKGSEMTNGIFLWRPRIGNCNCGTSTKPDQFRKTFNPELDVANSLAVKSSDHNWLLRRNLRFSGGVFANQYRRMSSRSFTAWLALTSRSLFFFDFY